MDIRCLSMAGIGRAVLFALLLINNATFVFAQGIIIDPPPGGPLPTLPLVVDPLRVEEQQIDVVIDGPLTQVHLTQVLRNHSAQTVEGTYLFPLPENAAISDFQMTVDGQVIEGQILPKEEALRTYEEIVRRRRDPALLQYIGRDLFQVSVFPIPAGATRTLELTYSQLLPLQDGLYQFRYPLALHQANSEPIKTLALNITIRNHPGLRTIYSPAYAITVDRTSDASAQIRYTATAIRPEQDFVLYFGADQSEIGLNILSYKPAGEDGYFLLLATPGLEVDAAAIVERDLIMVVDVSGSMQGEKFKQAQSAAHYVIDHLYAADRFNLIAFSTGVRLWAKTLQPAATDSVQAAHDWIDQLVATGSTDINRALLEALAQIRDDQPDRPTYILFLTDGLPTQGETAIDQILTNAGNNRPEDIQVRLFTFGVGFDVNTDLLDSLSRELGGRSSYVQPDERIDEEVSRFYAGISTPVLSNVTVQFGGASVVDDLYPYPLPDLFAGEQLAVAGRYRNAKAIDITLRGKINGTQTIYHYPAQRFVESGGEPNVARLWAARKISALLTQVRQIGPQQELIDAIVELSLQYGIVTPYTAAFVPEPGSPLPIDTDGRPIREEDEPFAPTSAAVSRERLATALSADMAKHESVGQQAVAASERLNELANAPVIQESSMARFINGRTFVPQTVVEGPDKRSLTLWVDTLYTMDMQLTTVQFGSDCYFALAKEPQVAAWLALAPDLIIVRDAQTALRITTLPTSLQAQPCLVWHSSNN